jgi:hypothetical protein
MELQNINNATTLVKIKNLKILFDPWIVGNIYQNSWSPYPKQKINKKWFQDVTHIYISHIDQDHWDIQTIKKINPKVKIIIPDIVFNKLIEKTLNELGYKNTDMVKMNTWTKLNKSVDFYIIPPLNEMAQEFDKYNKYKKFQPIAIDTGLIIRDKSSKTNHMILGDNSPYNLKSLKKHSQNMKFSTFWFPYNGYAQDYPLCYDNLSFLEKKKISFNLNLEREKILLKAIKIIDPEYLIPHSSDFALNGPRRKEFYRVHNKEFLNKEMYAKRIEKITKKKAYALFGGDTLIINKKNCIINKRTKFAESVKLPREIKLSFPKAVKNRLTLKEEFELSIKAMNERVIKYKIPKTGIKKWIFQIETESEKLYANLENV